MKKILILLVLFLTACNQENYTPKLYNDEDIIRYENDEVICYVYRGFRKGGISCKWKENVMDNVIKPKSKHSEGEE